MATMIRHLAGSYSHFRHKRDSRETARPKLYVSHPTIDTESLKPSLRLSSYQCRQGQSRAAAGQCVRRRPDTRDTALAVRQMRLVATS